MNWKKSLKVAIIVCLALVIAAIPLLGSACAGGGSKVKVGFSICYTGVAAEKGRPMGNAKLDCIKYINEELGGVGAQVDRVLDPGEKDPVGPIIVRVFACVRWWAVGGPGGVAGDANCDAEVNSIDAALALQRNAGLIGPLPCEANADVNRDGEVSSIDAALILQFVVGLLASLPP